MHFIESYIKLQSSSGFKFPVNDKFFTSYSSIETLSAIFMQGNKYKKCCTYPKIYLVKTKGGNCISSINSDLCPLLC